MATVIVHEDEIAARKIKKRKIILSVGFLIVATVAGFVFWPENEKVETVSFAGKGTSSTGSALGANGGLNAGTGGRRDVGIDGNWGVANNPIDRLKADPELAKDPLKFKKAVEAMNAENDKLISSNLISSNELKSHKTKTDCRTSFDGYVHNVTAIFSTGYDADGKLSAVCGKESDNEIKSMGLETAIGNYKIGKLRK